jgi:hypothetical protein
MRQARFASGQQQQEAEMREAVHALFEAMETAPEPTRANSCATIGT